MNNFKPNENFKYYLNFIAERMNIFWARHYELEQPHTDDEIFKNFKFTNVYRSLDRVSQFLISKVIYDTKGLANERDTEDIFWRIILFKHFNKPETWLALEAEFGEINLATPIKEMENYLTHLAKIQPIYSNAYMLTASFMRNSELMAKNKLYVGQPKHSAYLQLFKNALLDNDMKGMYSILKSQSLAELQTKLESGIVAVGKFISMQFAIDLNYSLIFNFDENEHIIAGPGAEKGIHRTFSIEGKPDYVEIIKWVTRELPNLMHDYGFGERFISLPNRMPTLIDMQNCFCETDKYLRGAGIVTEGVEVEGKRIKQVFRPSKEKIDYFFPPKWNVKF
jgi:hypothetical protein